MCFWCSFILFFYTTKNNYRIKLPNVVVKKFCQISVFIVCSFQALASILGREGTYQFDFLYYIAIYVSAPLVNLNNYIINKSFEIDYNIANNVTLRQIINYLGNRLDIQEWQFKGDSDLGHQFINDLYLGNVKTVYGSFLNDGGYLALIVYVVIMAVISQFLYNLTISKLSRNLNSDIVLPLIYYSRIVFYLFFSFFAEEFYLNLFTIDTLRSIVYYNIIKRFLIKTKIKF